VDYRLQDGRLGVEVRVDDPDDGAPLERDTFAWQILTALTEDVTEHVEPGALALGFRKRGGHP
jgi:hypothetical protein